MGKLRRRDFPVFRRAPRSGSAICKGRTCPGRRLSRQHNTLSDETVTERVRVDLIRRDAVPSTAGGGTSWCATRRAGTGLGTSRIRREKRPATGPSAAARIRWARSLAWQLHVEQSYSVDLPLDQSPAPFLDRVQ